MHCNLLRGLGMPSEEGDQIAVDHHESNLSESDRALLDFAVKLGTRVSEFSRKMLSSFKHLVSPRNRSWNARWSLLSIISQYLQMGLGIEPDLSHLRTSKISASFRWCPDSYSGGGVVHLVDTLQDTEAGLVAQAQSGKLEAFEELARHHGQLIYRTLTAILGNQPMRRMPCRILS